MSDSFQSFDGGLSPFVKSMRTINDMLAVGREYRDTRGAGNSAPGIEVNPTFPSVTVTVKNDTGANVPAFSVLALGETTIDVTSTEWKYELRARPIFHADTPAATTDAVCITIEGIPAGECGRAVISGHAVCTVDVTDAGHEYATPTAGDESKLTSAASGPVRIIHKPSGTGDLPAVVFVVGVSLELPAAVNGSDILAGSYVITTNAVFEDTGAEITVPSAGTYQLFGTVRASGELSAGVPTTSAQGITARLWDQTNSAVVPGTTLFCMSVQLLNEPIQGSSAFTVIATVSGATTYRLQGARSAGAGPTTWVSSEIFVGSSIGYVKLS